LSTPVGSAEDGVRLTLHVQPGASRSELAGRHGDALKVRVAAPPVDGAANRELIRFLAAQLGVARASITVVAGSSGRRKTVRVRGLSVADATRKLGL
jgi:uncharacterized protein (TIGR00251 family)